MLSLTQLREKYLGGSAAAAQSSGGTWTRLLSPADSATLERQARCTHTHTHTQTHTSRHAHTERFLLLTRRQHTGSGASAQADRQEEEQGMCLT